MKKLHSAIAKELSFYPDEWHEAVSDWLEDCVGRGFTEATVHNYSQNLRTALSFIQDEDEPALTPNTLCALSAEKYENMQNRLIDSDYKPTSINSISSALTSFIYDRSTRIGQGMGSFIAGKLLPQPALYKSVPRKTCELMTSANEVCSNAFEADSGRDWIRRRDNAIMSLITSTGAKTAEICKLKCPYGKPDDWETLTFPGNNKHVRKRELKLSRSVKKALVAYIETWPHTISEGCPLFMGVRGGALHSRTVCRILSNASNQLGFQNEVLPRQVRNGVAKACREEGKSVEKTAEYLGIKPSKNLADMVGEGCEIRSPRKPGDQRFAALKTLEEREILMVPRRYMSHLASETNVRLVTIPIYTKHIDNFANYLISQKIKLAEANEAVLNDFLLATYGVNSQGKKVQAKNVIQRCWKWLVLVKSLESYSMGVSQTNGTRHIKKLTEIANNENIEQLFLATDQSQNPKYIEAGALAALALTLSMQLNELPLFKRADFKYKAGKSSESWIKINEQKYDIDRAHAQRIARCFATIPHHDENDVMLPSLVSPAKSKELTSYAGRILKIVCNELGMDRHLTWRSIRNRGIVTAIEQGMDLNEVAEKCRLLDISRLVELQEIVKNNRALEKQSSNDNHFMPAASTSSS